SAQWSEVTGAITGGVRDIETGQPIPGAVVTVRNEENGLTRTTLANRDGVYNFAYLQPGFYRVSARSEGYEEIPDSSTNNFPVKLAKVTPMTPPPIRLRKAGAAPPTAPVQPAPTPTPGPRASRSDSDVEQLVNTVSAARSGNFSQLQLTTLPLPGIRSFETLAFLLPGVAPPPQAVGGAVGPGIGAGVGTAGQFSVNGQRARSNNFTVDGSDNNDEDVGVRRQGFVSLVPQSIESVQEFQMFTHLWDAGVGRNLGSQVNAISKPGLNRVHGALYGFFTGTDLNARNFFDYTSDKAQSYQLTARARARFTGQSEDRVVPVTILNSATDTGAQLAQPNPSGFKDQNNRSQAGASIGFPIFRDKTFFFGSFERQHVRAQEETHFSVPTIAQRGFLGSGATGFTIPGLDLAGNLNPTFRPTFTAGDAVFSLFPRPNNPIGPYGENTFTQVLPADAEGTIFSIKLDHSFKLFGPNIVHTLTGRYNFTDDERQLPAVGGALFSRLKPRVGTQNLSLFLSSQLTSRISNEARGSYGRTRLRFEALPDPFLSPSHLAASDPINGPLLLNTPSRFINVSCAGLPTTQTKYGCFTGLSQNLAATFVRQTPAGTVPTSAGDIPITGVETNLGPIGQVIVAPYSPVGLDSYLFPQGRVNNTFQAADTLTIFSGDHNFRFGADIRRAQLNSFLNRNFRPQVVFGGTADLTMRSPLSGLPIAYQGLSRLGDTPGFFSGSDLAALGLPTGIFQALSIGAPNTEIGLRSWQHNFFFNDTWRVRRGLTLDYGLRYEYNTVPREVNRRIEDTFGLKSVPPADPSISLNADTSAAITAFNDTLGALKVFLDGRETIYDPDRNNFGPHFGFAWDPFAASNTQAGKTVIRGGAGIYYDVALGNVISQSRNVFPNFVPVNTDVNLFARSISGLLPDGRRFEGFSRIFNLFFLGATFFGGADSFRGASCSQVQTGVFGCDVTKPNTLNVLGPPPGALQAYLGRLFYPAEARRPFSGGGLAFTLPDRNLRSPQAY
ncbi:MAG: carboxypeptidase-like regulatory domain-containing protein, partial [Blastocatellia bacterium]